MILVRAIIDMRNVEWGILFEIQRPRLVIVDFQQ